MHTRASPTCGSMPLPRGVCGCKLHAGSPEHWDPLSKKRTAVAMDSSRMLARSASSLPSSAQQILEPMRIFPGGSMPYSLGITQSASCFATWQGHSILKLHREGWNPSLGNTA